MSIAVRRIGIFSAILLAAATCFAGLDAAAFATGSPASIHADGPATAPPPQPDGVIWG
jgi:hypothetical protein